MRRRESSGEVDGTNKKPDGIYFNSRRVKVQNRYVAWVDVLGTKAALLVSHARAANFVMRLHAACIEPSRRGIDLFPMNDGFYACADRWGPLREFLNKVYGRLAECFTTAKNSKHRFLIRGAVAYGPVSSGQELAGDNRTLGGTAGTEHIKGVVLGMPLAQTVEAERTAPPFGIVVHESARAFHPEGGHPIPDVFCKWWTAAAPLPPGFKEALREHYDWLAERPCTSLYPADARKRHWDLACEYFELRESEAPPRSEGMSAKLATASVD